MSVILFITCVTTFIMLIWFKTDAIIEWSGLFGLHKLGDNFRNAKINAAPNPLTYPQYLKKYHDNFFTRLCSCPFCLCTWLVAFQCFGLAILLGNILFAAYFPVVYCASLIVYAVILKLYNITS